MTKTISSLDEKLSLETPKSCDSIADKQQCDEAPAHSIVQPPFGGLQIIHATTGRVRIRANVGSDNVILDTICQNLRQQDGVTEVFVNKQTGSVIVSFDENQLSLPQMLTVLQKFGIHTATSPQSASKSDPFAAWKSLDFWKEQGISFIPLMTGLAVTGGLGINGLAALPVYLLTADATRWVIDYLPAARRGGAGGAGGDKRIINFSSSASPASPASPSLPDSSAKVAYSVVHAIRGRIRFNVPRIVQDRAYAKRLERLLKTDPQVISVRVNCDAASIAIAYKPNEIPTSHWVGLMQLADKTIPQTIPVKTTTEEPRLEQISQPTEPKELAQETQEPIETANVTTTKEPCPEQISQPTEPKELAQEIQEPIETANIWSKFKPPALWTSLTYLAKFPLDPTTK